MHIYSHRSIAQAQFNRISFGGVHCITFVQRKHQNAIGINASDLLNYDFKLCRHMHSTSNGNDD